ncbi:MAG: hypothetical protein AB7N53_06140 [Candidatus Binatia bacterium]
MKSVREACAADPRGDECEAAHDALRACLRPCREQLKDDLATCKQTLRQCVETCGASAE